MHLLILCFALLTSLHAETVRVPSATPVYKAADSTSRVLFQLKAGEVVEITPFNDEFAKVRVRRTSGKTYSGYVDRLELDVTSEPAVLAGGGPEALGRAARQWALLAGGEYISLSQSGKNIADADSVQYMTSGYKSTSPAGFLGLQLGEGSFWRLEAVYMTTDYTTAATQNIQGAPPLAVVLKQTIALAKLEKAWAPLASKHYYFGLGAKAGKVLAVKLTLGGTTLPTTSDDLPLVLGGFGFAGANFDLSKSLGAFIELRVSSIVNQSPMIIGLEGALGLSYWL